MKRLAGLLLLLPLAWLAPSAAEAATGAWVEGPHIRLRLVAARPQPAGPLEAAIEMELDPGWKTYWRSPGDAGIPPQLDFSASTNASGAEIGFPAPERDDDGFSVTNVYHDRVVLPVRFAESEPGEPVTLALAAALGVCKDICLPVSLEARLDIPPEASDDGAAAAIDAARAALPGPGEPGTFEIVSLERVGGSDAAPDFEVKVKAATPGPLFVETPADWYPAPAAPVATGDGSAVYRFSVDRRSAKAPFEGAVIRLTLAGDDAATTRAFRLGADDSAVALPAP